MTVGVVGGGSGALPCPDGNGAVGLGTDGEDLGPSSTDAAGESAAFSVTRTVSFFRGTLAVCEDGFFSFSLM